MSLEKIGSIITPNTQIYTTDQLSGCGTIDYPLGLTINGNYRHLLFSADNYNATSAVTLSENRFNYDALLYKVGSNSKVDGVHYFTYPNISGLNTLNLNFMYGGGENEYYAYTYGTWSDNTHLIMTKSKSIRAPLTAVSITGTRVYTAQCLNCIYEVWGVNNL